MSVLDALIAKMREAGNKDGSGNLTGTDLDQYRGMLRTKHQLEQDQREVDDYNSRIDDAISNLTTLRNAGLTSTSSGKNKGGKKGGGSGSKTDPEKEAYELKKSEIEVVQKQLELEKSKLEEQKKGLEQQKSALELDKSQIELQKQIKE